MKTFSFKINGTTYETAVNELENNQLEIVVNGKNYIVETEPTATTAETTSAPSAAAPSAPVVENANSATPAATGSVKVKSPLPGSVIKVLVSEGQAIKKGDTLLVLESMKMENAINAEQDGVVSQIAVSAGQNVMQDDLLIVLG